MSASSSKRSMRFYPMHKDESQRREDLAVLFSDMQGEGYLTSHNAAASGGDAEHLGSGRKFIVELVGRLIEGSESDVITVVREVMHVDSSFRDAFYSYFSHQHFGVKRFSARLTFFKGEIDQATWDNGDKHAILASCVIDPLRRGAIGKTYIDPKAWIHDENTFVRTSKFKVNVFGSPFFIRAFPYRTQDGESVRCAEVTILNLLHYYSNEYPDYANLEASAIRSLAARYSYERNIPSRGMSYLTLSRVFSDLGFKPRLYGASSWKPGAGANMDSEQWLKRLMHYYVDSGIPVAINPSPGDEMPGHSLVCVGYNAESNGRLREVAYSRRSVFKHCVTLKDDEPSDQIKVASVSVSLMDAADYYDKYVVIDDNQCPYAIRSSEHLSLYSYMRNEFLVAPLHRSMVLDAVDARERFVSILSDPKHGIINMGKEYLETSENVDSESSGSQRRIVMRMFMASSKSFKRARVSMYGKLAKTESGAAARRALYQTIALPHFIWVCELYFESHYLERGGSAFAEVLLDATSARPDSTGGIILSNYPNRLAARTPESTTDDYELFLDCLPCPIVPYCENLSAAG